MRLPNWKFRSVEEEREEDARRLHEAAWPDMFANLQSAYSELTNAQFELERRTSEISETRDLFQQVISSMSEALFLTDRSGRVIRANPAAAALLECQETSILGRPLTAVCGSEDIPATPWKLMEIAPTGRITNLDVDVQTMGGGTIPVSFSLGLMHDKQNKITGVLAVARDMREHRSLINSLVAARTRFQELLEFAPDAIVLANQDGEIVLVNSQAENIFGYKRDELLGANVEMLVPERLRGQAFEATAVTDDALLSLEDALLSEHASGASEQLEFSLLNRDGHEFPAEIARRQIETEDGVMMMSLIRDITDRKRAEDARRAAETRYQGLFDNANDIVYTNDLQGNFTSMNKMASRLTGYSLEEALHLNTQQVIAPEYLPLVFQRIQAQLGGQTNLTPYDLELICKDGTRAPVEISTRLIFENGQPIGFQGIARDIRERKQNERMQARLNHQAMLRADVGTALTDEQSTLQQVLQRCSEALVTHLDAAVARIWLLNEEEQVLELEASSGLYMDLDGPQARVPVGKLKVGLIAQEKAPHLTNDVPNDPYVGDEDWAQREGMVAFAGYPLMVGDRLIGVMALFAKHQLEPDTLNALAAIADTIVHGVERKRIEDEREALLLREHEARLSAETANNLKDDFLAMISHELRAPLTAILGWAQMLRGGSLDRVSAERALLTIERNAKSQAHLVGDLLDASRIATGKLSLEAKPVELMSVVDAAVDAVRPSVEAKSLRLQITLEPWVGPFAGDAERLKQVVWNLLSNAIKFTPAGGLIEVRLERLEQKALLIVSDTGQGIDPEFIPHIFDRFRQADNSAKRRQGGLGLGLAIVKHIVELHGGAIYAYSRGAGQGSDFMITLPLTVPKQAQANEESELWPTYVDPQMAVRTTSLRGARVLVVDDELDTREVLSVMLARYGTEIRTAGSAAEALTIFRQWRPDVLVSDIGMPEQDGYALIEQIRALPQEDGADIPAIALTAFASAHDRERALTSGFQRHLSKPIEPVELAKTVARILGRSEEGITL